MRGKVSSAVRRIDNVGITPAYAGKSPQRQKLRSPSKDHPRLCGEKRSQRLLMVLFLGSPPPMRGKVILKNRLKIFFRITPAYAGKSEAQK